MSTEGNANRLESASGLGKLAEAYWKGVRSAAWERGRPMVYSTAAFPHIVFHAADLPVYIDDPLAATLAARHQEQYPLRCAEEKGYSREMCSYLRVGAGCALMTPEERKGVTDPMQLIPPPSLVIHVEAGCISEMQYLDDMRRRFNVPYYVVETPFVWYKDEEEDAVADTLKDIKDMITFIEDNTHERYPLDKLKQQFVQLKKNATLRWKNLELMKATPAPATWFEMCMSIGGILYFPGDPRSGEVFQAINNEMTGRIAERKGAIDKEKHRVYWDGIMCYPRIGHLSRTCAEFGINPVVGRYTHGYFYNWPEDIDPEHPLEYCARYAVRAFTNRRIDVEAERIIRLCEEYKVDGMVFFLQHTCRPVSAQAHELLDIASKRLGIPAIFIEADMADSSYYSDAQVRTRLEAFAEMMEQNKRKK